VVVFSLDEELVFESGDGMGWTGMLNPSEAPLNESTWIYEVIVLIWLGESWKVGPG
jgi:hypothetical protein